MEDKIINLIKKYTGNIHTLKENRDRKTEGDTYDYELDIKLCSDVIKDLENVLYFVRERYLIMKNNSILFSSVDREDCWVSSGLCLKVDNVDKKNYEEIYNEVKSKIETKEVIDYVIEDNCLDCDLFDCDETYKFKRTYWDCALVYEFENEDGYEVDFRFNQTDTILSF